MRLFAIAASFMLAAGAALAAPATPPAPPKSSKKLRTAKRRPAPRIITLTPGQKRITPSQLKRGLTPEQKTALEAKKEAAARAARKSTKPAPKAAPKPR